MLLVFAQKFTAIVFLFLETNKKTGMILREKMLQCTLCHKAVVFKEKQKLVKSELRFFLMT